MRVHISLYLKFYLSYSQPSSLVLINLDAGYQHAYFRTVASAFVFDLCDYINKVCICSYSDAELTDQFCFLHLRFDFGDALLKRTLNLVVWVINGIYELRCKRVTQHDPVGCVDWLAGRFAVALSKLCKMGSVPVGLAKPFTDKS